MERTEVGAILARLGLDSEEFRFERIGRFSFDLWRVDLEDRSLIIKKPYRPSRPGEHWSIETYFYESFGDDFPVALPDYLGRVGSSLVLDFIPNLVAFDFGEGPSRQHALAAVDNLALLHAHFLRQPLPAFIPHMGDRTVRDLSADEYADSWHSNRAFFADVCPEFAKTGDALSGRLSRQLVPLAESPTLLHGDPHGENLPLNDEGNVVFLDWQSVLCGNPMLDLSIFICMSYDIGDRRRHEDALFARYVDKFESYGGRLADPWTDYRFGILKRAALIVEIVKHDFPSARWVFRRCAQAALDHHVIDLIV